MEAFVKLKSQDYSLLDNRTGEILEYRQTKKVTLSEFMMVFFASYTDMLKLTGLEIKVLMCIWAHSSFNSRNSKDGNIIHNDAAFKENCKQDGLNTTNSNIDNVFSRLNKMGFLIKKCRGAYLLNPKYFFKGTLSDRTKIQYNIMVEPEERQIQEDIKRMNEQLAKQN